MIIKHPLFSSVALERAVFINLEHNIPNVSGTFCFYDVNGSAVRVVTVIDPNPARPYLRLPIGTLSQSFRVVFFPNEDAGVWFNTNFEYSEGVTEIILTEPVGTQVAPTHKVAGHCLRDGKPFAGLVQVFSVFDQKHMGSVQASNITGEWSLDIGTAGEVFASVSLPYGRAFAPDLEVGVGDIIHPTAANNYIYEVSQSGTLGATEPTVWPIDTPVPHGTALLNPVAYPAPQIHGPIIPALI